MPNKIVKSITLDREIAELAEDRAKSERRSFSSLIEYLLSKYLRPEDYERRRNLEPQKTD